MHVQRSLRAAFTLVEILVVILIIALLIALMIPVVRGVMRRAEDFRVAQELANLEMAIYAYKEKYKDFPPDFSDCKFKPFNQTVAYRHILMAFPRIEPEELDAIRKFASKIDPAAALVLWLGGLSKDPKRPFTGKGGPFETDPNTAIRTITRWRSLEERTEPLFDFDESRWYFVDDSIAYFPPNRRIDPPPMGNKNLSKYRPSIPPPPPYVYFDSRTYAFADSSGQPQYASFAWPAPDGGGVTIARPYKSDIDNTTFNPGANPQDALFRDRALHWVNRDTFQLLCAGRDGEFGPLVNTSNPDLVFPDQNNNPVPVFTRFPSRLAFHPAYGSNPPAPYYLQGQDDNLSNFSEGQTMEQAKP